jgi:uncharacterized RDD family membrane protein YckC
VASAWFLGLALFIATLGVGYLTWSLMTWRQGRTPAQRMLGLRCWLPLEGRVAGRRDMAVRQISGACLNGQLLSGVFVWLFGEPQRSVGDVFADTIVMYDPDGILALRRSGGTPRPRPASPWFRGPTACLIRSWSSGRDGPAVAGG